MFHSCFFFQLTRRRGGFDVTHLRSSNLSNYAGVLHAVDNLPFVTNILQAFSCPGRTDPLHVDVVAYHGHVWVKIVARKAQALHLIWAGISFIASICETVFLAATFIIILICLSETAVGKFLEHNNVTVFIVAPDVFSVSSSEIKM